MTGVLILSGPSGSGKSSLVDLLSQKIQSYYFSISTTTRPPRGNEQHGVEYFFTDKVSFESGIKNGLFLEYANVHDHYYGTHITPVQNALKDGKLVILDIDVQGQEQVVSKIPDVCTSVFIAPPNRLELEERLSARGTDAPEVIQKRLINASQELKDLHRYDYLLINHHLEKTAQALLEIVELMAFKPTNDSVDRFIRNWY